MLEEKALDKPILDKPILVKGKSVTLILDNMYTEIRIKYSL